MQAETDMCATDVIKFLTNVRLPRHAIQLVEGNPCLHNLQSRGHCDRHNASTLGFAKKR